MAGSLASPLVELRVINLVLLNIELHIVQHNFSVPLIFCHFNIFNLIPPLDEILWFDVAPYQLVHYSSINKTVQDPVYIFMPRGKFGQSKCSIHPIWIEF